MHLEARNLQAGAIGAFDPPVHVTSGKEHRARSWSTLAAMISDDVLSTIESALVEGIYNVEEIFWLALEATDAGDEAYENELRAAVEMAFSRRLAEIATWNEPTDCDRLSDAFRALERQGLVAMQDAGLDMEESSFRAVWLECTRDELGGPKVRGRCFFTANDRWRAMSGEGLSLAYWSTEKAPTEKVTTAEPERCPRCGGSGWLPARTPQDFPRECGCSGQKPVAPPVAPTPVEKIGAEVAEACRRAGLTTSWDGRQDSYIRIPNFRWQRRLTLSTEADIRNFLESWEFEIRAGYFPFNPPIESILEILERRAGEWFKRFADFGPRLRERLRKHTEQFVIGERATEATWGEPTVLDRIRGAFEELTSGHILAQENLGLTIQDGWGYAGKRATREHRGVVFFHHEDVLDAVEARPLLLAFGAIPTSSHDEVASSVDVANAALSVLKAHGIQCSWSGCVDDRIVITPFAWQRRRWTKTPGYARTRPSSAPSVRPSLIARLFGSKPSSTTPSNVQRAGRLNAPEAAIVVSALHDENGFDLQRSRAMRAAWHALGETSDAQMSHLGFPHIFVPANLFTTVMPRLALANLREERAKPFLRAAGKAPADGSERHEGR